MTALEMDAQMQCGNCQAIYRLSLVTLRKSTMKEEELAARRMGHAEQSVAVAANGTTRPVERGSVIEIKEPSAPTAKPGCEVRDKRGMKCGMPAGHKFDHSFPR
jgi:hypothetical protein